MLKKRCKTCLIADKQQSVCGLTELPINLEKDYCPQHKTEFYTCEMCGKPILSGIFIEMIEDKPHIYCERCNMAIGTCATCTEITDCRFETDSSCPLPPIVVKTIRQDNAIVQMQVRNEEREKIVCPSCKCWNGEECNRQSSVGCNKFSRRNS